MHALPKVMCVAIILLGGAFPHARCHTLSSSQLNFSDRTAHLSFGLAVMSLLCSSRACTCLCATPIHASHTRLCTYPHVNTNLYTHVCISVLR